MSKEALLAVGLAGVLLAGGCESTPETTPDQINEASEPIVDLNVLPSSLPAPVTDRLSEVVAVEALKPLPPKMINGISLRRSVRLDGSGVRIAPNLYLSAGHVAYDGDGEELPGIRKCGNLTVHTQSTHYTALGGNDRKLFGEDITVYRHTGSFMADSRTNIPDISLLYAPQSARLLPEFKKMKIAKGVHIGDELFLENYEPTADGKSRDPYEVNLRAKGIKLGLNKPAAYGALVLSKSYDGQIVVVDGLKSYGKIFDNLTRGGASGGPVFNSAGELVGLSVGSSPTNHMTMNEVENYYDVKLEGVTNNKHLAYTFIQPITKELIKRLTQSVKQAEVCHDPLSTMPPG